MKHRAAFTLGLAALAAATTLPDGHLEKINALQAARGKPALEAEQIIARPIRLFGNKLTSYFTRVPDAELRALAQQINASGGPMLSAHMTDNTPLGTFYQAAVTLGDVTPTPELGEPSQELWLDTWAYWLADEEGDRLARLIDGGIINEASIGYWYEHALCSITGSSYWQSPYYAGRTYDITDPETGDVTQKLCFIWTTGVEFAEGSLVYRGAYPGTRVGGTTTAGQVAASAPTTLTSPSTTRFQLAASADLRAVFEKTAGDGASGEPPAPERATSKGEFGVKLKLKLPDGSVKEIELDAAQGVLDDAVRSALDDGQQQERQRVATALGLEPKDVTDVRLAKLRAEAEQGVAYRADLLERLGTASIAAGRTPESAERLKRLSKDAPIADLQALVAEAEAERDARVPATRLSKDAPDTTEQAPARAPDLDAV